MYIFLVNLFNIVILCLVVRVIVFLFKDIVIFEMFEKKNVIKLNFLFVFLIV